jgi:hypothetical protein
LVFMGFFIAADASNYEVELPGREVELPWRTND